MAFVYDQLLSLGGRPTRPIQVEREGDWDWTNYYTWGSMDEMHRLQDFELHQWRQFREFQLQVRRNPREFARYDRRVHKYRQKRGIEEGIQLRQRPEQQTKIDEWKEYHYFQCRCLDTRAHYFPGTILSGYDNQDPRKAHIQWIEGELPVVVSENHHSNSFLPIDDYDEWALIVLRLKRRYDAFIKIGGRPSRPLQTEPDPQYYERRLEEVQETIRKTGCTEHDPRKNSAELKALRSSCRLQYLEAEQERVTFEFNQWRRFLQFQQRKRQDRAVFSEYEQSVSEYRQRKKFEGEIQLQLQPEQQTKLDEWKEFQYFQYRKLSYQRRNIEQFWAKSDADSLQWSDMQNKILEAEDEMEQRIAFLPWIVGQLPLILSEEVASSQQNGNDSQIPQNDADLLRPAAALDQTPSETPRPRRSATNRRQSFNERAQAKTTSILGSVRASKVSKPVKTRSPRPENLTAVRQLLDEVQPSPPTVTLRRSERLGKCEKDAQTTNSVQYPDGPLGPSHSSRVNKVATDVSSQGMLLSGERRANHPQHSNKRMSEPKEDLPARDRESTSLRPIHSSKVSKFGGKRSTRLHVNDTKPGATPAQIWLGKHGVPDLRQSSKIPRRSARIAQRVSQLRGTGVLSGIVETYRRA